MHNLVSLVYRQVSLTDNPMDFSPPSTNTLTVTRAALKSRVITVGAVTSSLKPNVPSFWSKSILTPGFEAHGSNVMVTVPKKSANVPADWHKTKVHPSSNSHFVSKSGLVFKTSCSKSSQVFSLWEEAMKAKVYRYK